MEWNIDRHHDLSGYSRDGRACFSLLCTGYSFIPTDADDVPAFFQSFLQEVQAPLYKRKALLRLFGETGERAVGLSRVDVSNGQCPRHDGRLADVVASPAQ